MKRKRPPLRQNVQDTWAIEQARRDADLAHRLLNEERLSEADANRLLLETIDLPTHGGDDYYIWIEEKQA